MTLENALPYLFLFLGIVSRVFLPWLISRRNAAAAGGQSLPWSWRFVWPQLVSVGVVVLLLPFLLSNLANIAELEYTAAYLAGWAAADLGREADKLLFKQPAT
jgi:hypothetical protein